MEEVEEGSTDDLLDMIQLDEKLNEYKTNWRSDFIRLGGFDHLFRIFNQFSEEKLLSMDIFDKNISDLHFEDLQELPGGHLRRGGAQPLPNHHYRELPAPASGSGAWIFEKRGKQGPGWVEQRPEG